MVIQRKQDIFRSTKGQGKEGSLISRLWLPKNTPTFLIVICWLLSDASIASEIMNIYGLLNVRSPINRCFLILILILH